jgi:hypothetical protein
MKFPIVGIKSIEDDLSRWDDDGGRPCQPPTRVKLRHPRTGESILIPNHLDLLHTIYC